MHTIVAIATALAKSAISIVRLSGADSLRIASRLLTPARSQSQSESHSPSNLDSPNLDSLNLEPRKAVLRSIYDSNGNMLDKAIIIYFQAPASFTGEDIVEIQSHGGLLIANEIVRSCLFFGASLARAGEFSMRALRNNKLDLVELEATLALINNTNTNLTKLLTRNLDGQLSRMLESIRTQILTIIAHLEVSIDYSEEDLDPTMLSQSLATLHSIEQQFQAVLDSSRHYQRLQHAKLCILGKPNVGKSSLLNLLLLQERAIVSDVAGTTRDTITSMLDICGNLVMLTDTAGVRTATDSIEQQGIERSLQSARESDILLCVFDSSKPMDSEDRAILDFIETQSDEGKSLLIVLNKSDLPRENFHDFGALPTITLNTKDSHHASALKERIASFLTMEIDSHTLIVTSSMQGALLESACVNLKAAATLLREGAIELASYELQQSLQSLGNMTSPYNVEEMLDSMFSQFCVGK